MSQPSSILIVDDLPLGRQTLGALLQGQGYQLLFAADGPSALEIAAEHLPDLVLLDVMMPQMDGFEVCRRMRASSGLAEAPIIMVTALDDRQSRLRGIEAGADDFIAKPFDRAELRARVRSITRLNRYRTLLEERQRHEHALWQIAARDSELANLQEANRFKSQFISDVAHELRTPLQILTLTSDNLDSIYDQLDEPQRRRLMRRLRDQIEVLNQMVDQVLDLSRADTKAERPARREINVAELARIEVARQMPLAEQRRQQLAMSGGPDLIAYGNAEQIGRAIRNLLNNALKYTPEGGAIGCEWRLLAAPAEHGPGWPASPQLAAGSYAALRVYDNGIGISADNLPRIFERFFRVAAESNVPGTGLGLALTRELVENNGGQIVVESTPQVGSNFVVYLPICDEDTYE